MSIFALLKAKNWFERRIQSALKHKKISILITLILVSGCFFYNQLLGIFPQCYADDYETEGHLEHEKEWMAKINYVEAKVDNQETEPKKVYVMNKATDKKDEEKEAKNELYQLVGNAPIREMVPAIMKTDQRVAAFLIGIAKKESDWGRHAPSQSGKTCYNYWGYKGSGSRGVSMGYACFGSPEEAVETVGHRIETLIAKNINSPSQMLVWKCGSSCAGHDPSGVQKWISDVSLYFGKVMQIRNS